MWSISQQEKAGDKGVIWDGVRNYQARNNLKKMRNGDLCLFYHSNIGKEIVGIVEVIKEAFLDPTDKKKKFVAVKVKFKQKVLPGDTIVFKSELISPIRRGICHMFGQAFVGKKLVMEAELMAQMKKVK